MTDQSPPTADIPDRAGAMRLVHRYVGISAVAGLNPIPVLDVTVLGGVHVSLIKALTEYYGREFSEHAARNILIAIAATLVPGAIGSILGRRILTALPFITPGGGMGTMAMFSAAVSYGLGMMFIRHFERGGTLDSFDPRNLHRVLATVGLSGR